MFIEEMIHSILQFLLEFWLMLEISPTELHVCMNLLLAHLSRKDVLIRGAIKTV